MYDFEEIVMPVDMEFSTPITILEGDDYNKDNAFKVIHDDDNNDDEKLEDFNNLKPTTIGKPPRHASSLRHSLSSTRLMVASSDLVC
jgi:protein phosphatase 2C family protein 2/3